MRRVMGAVCAAVLAAGGTMVVADAPRPRQSGGWTIPTGAAEEKSPLTTTAAVLAAGQKVFAGKCQRCHGPKGQGDGPDANRAARARMDLTSAANAAANPDGVVFHKVWNGRSSPRMPAFREELSREQTWAVVAYVQSLRRPPSGHP